MKLYYYIDTGHRIGLDRLRRSAPVINALGQNGIDVTMLTNDFRAGEYAKEQFGIKKYVSVDVVRNIANIATPADSVVLDTDSESSVLLSDMAGYYGKLVHISDYSHETAESSQLRITADIADPRYFGKNEHTPGNIFFWGDDDYEQELLGLSEIFENTETGLLEGYYFFMQYASELEDKFSTVYDSESYDEVLKGAGRFITSSPQSALEALAAGSRPVYIRKASAPEVWSEKLAGYGIPVLKSFEKDALQRVLEIGADYKNELLVQNAAEEAAQSIINFLQL